MNNSSLGLLPDEASASETRGKQTETVAIPPQQLDDVDSATAKHEYMSGERLLLQNVLHMRTQPIKSAAQVRHSCCNPDLGPDRKLDHRRRLSSRVRSNVGSAPLSTLITARPGSSMWIAPPAAGTTTSGARFSSCEFDTLTGSSATLDSLSSPRSNARLHLNSWFAFMPCARATTTTQAPGLNVSCTIASFSEAVRHRRTRRPVLTKPSAMCRSSPATLSAARGGRAYAYHSPG